jgi:hypothetical protein
MIKNFKSTRALGAFFIIAFASLLCSCATYQGKISAIRDTLEVNPAESVEQLAPLANKEGKDQLVYLLDYATALQVAGKYKESVDQFIKADRLADLKDYLSVSKYAASLLFNQEQVPYRGDDYELMMINAMNALNFLMLKDYDGALVETRRINEKLKWISERTKKSFQRNPFATYLAALIWEGRQKWDDAYIDFKAAYALDPSIPTIKEDLVRTAHRAQRITERDKHIKDFAVNIKPEWNTKTHGTVIVLHLAGWGPRKQPRPDNFRFPTLYPVWTKTNGSKLEVNGYPPLAAQKVYSVEEASMKTLEEEYGELVAKRMAGIVAKEVVSHQVRRENEAAGALLNLFMHISDRADLRQWSTLPASINLIRWEGAPGKYSMTVRSSEEEAAQYTFPNVDVKAGKTQFLVWRTF